MKSAVQVVFVVALIAAGVVAWWLSSRDAAATLPKVDASVVVDGPGDTAPAPAVADTGDAEREAVAAPEPEPEPQPQRKAEEPLDPSAAKVEPWLLRFEVVDESDAPVAGAAVTIWEARRARRPAGLEMGLKGNSYSGRHGDPVFELVTDALGAARVEMDLECFVVTASKDGAGSTGERTIWHSNAREEPVRIVLERAIVLRGLVLRADGLPAAGAEVEARQNGMSGASIARGRPAKLEPVIADADGRFTFSPVREGFGYSLDARLGDERSFRESVWIRSAEPPEVVLSFPGAITLRGVVVDEEGAPVAGATVQSWREFKIGDPDQDPDADETARVEADDEGRFEIAVRKHTRYQLVADEDGYAASAPVWLAPNRVRPHAEARLVLRRPAAIAGRVVRGDGSPFAGVTVLGRAEQGERRMYSSVPNRQDLYGRPESAKTDDEGRFRLLVHPDTTWEVAARWVPDNYRMSVRVPGVRPGDSDVTIRVDDESLAGCVVRGVVSVDGDGELAHYKIEIVNYEGGEAISSSQAKAEFDGLRFTLAPLPLGVGVALRVTPKDNDARHAQNTGPFAPFVYGPFTPDRAELSIDVPLQRWGELPVRVQKADGSPAVGVRVIGVPTTSAGFYPSPRSVDDAGAVVLRMLLPGEADLRVFDGSDKLFDERVSVEPGRNPERIVRLPAPSSPSAGGR